MSDELCEACGKPHNHPNHFSSVQGTEHFFVPSKERAAPPPANDEPIKYFTELQVRNYLSESGYYDRNPEVSELWAHGYAEQLNSDIRPLMQILRECLIEFEGIHEVMLLDPCNKRMKEAAIISKLRTAIGACPRGGKKKTDCSSGQRGKDEPITGE